MFSAKPLVFLSYSRKDQDKVAALRKRLASAGVRTWLDTQDIMGGEWRSAIKRGLRQSNFFIACLSKNTEERGEVLQYEWDSALEIQRERLEGEYYLIPARLEPCELPDSLRHLQCLDLYEPDGWDRLKRVLRTKARRLPFAAAAAVTVILGAVFADAFLLRPSAGREFLDARIQGRSAAPKGPSRIGITLWKMEPSKQTDPPSVREIVHPAEPGQAPAATAEWTPVRLPAGGSFKLGDNFEVTLESSRSGYLYVVNRSYRSDGSKGRPSVIFPSTRIRGGDNLVSPGMMVRLPDRGSHPWQFSSSDPNYAGELLIVLLSPQPVQNLPVAAEGVPIDESILDEWSRLYGAKVRSTTHVGPDLRLTVAEANARDKGAQLPRSAPLPAVLFEADRKADDPILVSMAIPVSRN